MGIWDKLGETIGKAFTGIGDSMLKTVSFKHEQLEDVNREIASASLDPDKFKTKEVKKLAQDIKERLKTSPAGPADWIQGILGDFMTNIWDVAISIMLPAKMDTFEDAKASATWLTFLFADFVILAAVLDMVGTAFSATLVRNLIHIFRLFAATFGMDRYLDAVIAPALTTSIVPKLTAGYHKQYQTTIPPLPDMIRFADFGSFDPDIIALWKEFYDAPEWIREPMSLSGIGGDWANKYWFSHWRQPGRFELGELHRRGLIDDSLVKNAYLTQGFSSFWQGLLLQLAKEPWTRVDTRRMWDMRTISEEEMRKAYRAVGYYDEQLEGMILWTKVYVAFPDLIARWKNGWISIDDVRAELTGLGMPSARVEEMLETKMKPAAPERTAKEKDITKTDIIKGVKKDVINRDEGVELLMDMGYDEDEAEYILAINIPVDEQESVVKERQLTKAEILKGLKTEVITEEEAFTRLIALRYTPSDAEFILSMFKAQVAPPVEPRAKEASKADIVAGVKKGLITPEDGYLMLQDIDYSPEAAQFILAVKAEVSPFSPVSYNEFKELTQGWRKAVGKEVKEVPEELKSAAANLLRLTKEVEHLMSAIKEEEAKLIDVEVLPEAATARLEELRVSWRRAEAELARVKMHYDEQLAIYRHPPTS